MSGACSVQRVGRFNSTAMVGIVRNNRGSGEDAKNGIQVCTDESSSVLCDKTIRPLRLKGRLY